jgi:hypothetical protein
MSIEVETAGADCIRYDTACAMATPRKAPIAPDMAAAQ